MKGWKRIFYENYKNSYTNKLRFQDKKMVTGDKEHFIMIKGSICQQDEIIINRHACKIHEAKHDRTNEKWGVPQ